VVLGDKEAPVEPWAAEFDAWVAGRVEAREYRALFEYPSQANTGMAVPTSEHFDPIFVAMGAAFAEEGARTIYEGFHYGTISMRSFGFG
jgi:4,5-DOPA dioxygenase extradiol